MHPREIHLIAKATAVNSFEDVDFAKMVYSFIFLNFPNSNLLRIISVQGSYEINYIK